MDITVGRPRRGNDPRPPGYSCCFAGRAPSHPRGFFVFHPAALDIDIKPPVAAMLAPVDIDV
jgi:hypothetical protein